MLLYVTLIPKLIRLTDPHWVFVVDHEVTTNPIVGRAAIIRLCGQLPVLVWRNDGRTVYVFAILPQRPVCMIIDEWIIIKMKRVGYDGMECQCYHRIFVNWESVGGRLRFLYEVSWLTACGSYRQTVGPVCNELVLNPNLCGYSSANSWGPQAILNICLDVPLISRKYLRPDSLNVGGNCMNHPLSYYWNWILPRAYGGAGKSSARSTSRCVLFEGENISFDASLVIYIYIYI